MAYRNLAPDAVALAANGVKITFPGDLSADRASTRIPVPAGCNRATVYVGWPATGTPVGTLTPKSCGSSATTDGLACRGVTPLAVSGTGYWIGSGIELDGALFFALDYTRTSGGTGANLTDHNGAGSPFVVFYSE